METLKKKVGRPRKETTTTNEVTPRKEKVEDKILKCNEEIHNLENKLKEELSVLRSRYSKIESKLTEDYRKRIEIYETEREHLKDSLLSLQMKPHQTGLILLMERTKWGSGVFFSIIKKPRMSYGGECSGFVYNKIGTVGIGNREDTHWLGESNIYTQIKKVVCTIQEFSDLCKQYKLKPTLNNKTLEKLYELRFKERMDNNTFSYTDLEKLGIIVK
jgi:hypothetical protein